MAWTPTDGSPQVAGGTAQPATPDQDVVVSVEVVTDVTVSGAVVFGGCGSLGSDSSVSRMAVRGCRCDGWWPEGMRMAVGGAGKKSSLNHL
jgi:hypothetical protein